MRKNYVEILDELVPDNLIKIAEVERVMKPLNLDTPDFAEFRWRDSEGNLYDVVADVYLYGSEYGIDGGPISKLFIKPVTEEREPTYQKPVYEYDRGLSIDDIDKNVLRDIIRYIYGELKKYHKEEK